MINNKIKRKTKKAFTLTELSLALAIIGVLFIMIATIVANMISIYQKGTTITAVNSVGQSLINDMSNAITEAPSFSVAGACSHATNHDACQEHPDLAISIIKKQSGIGGSDISGNDIPTGGAFCTGKYSYIWNSGYVMPKEEGGTDPAYENGLDHASTIKYTNSNSDEREIPNNFRLIKIEDKYRLACVNLIDIAGQVNNGSTEFDLTANGPVSEDPVELINASDKRLALYQLSVDTSQQNQTTKRSLYSVSFILATIRGGINITGNSNYCSPPDNVDSDFDYCAINKFNFAIRTAGE